MRDTLTRGLGPWGEPVEGDVAFSLWPTEIEGKTTTGRLVDCTNFSALEAVVADDAKCSTSGTFFDPAPVLGNTLRHFVDARNLEAAPVMKGHGAVTSANLFSLSGNIQ